VDVGLIFVYADPAKSGIPQGKDDLPSLLGISAGNVEGRTGNLGMRIGLKSTHTFRFKRSPVMARNKKRTTGNSPRRLQQGQSLLISLGKVNLRVSFRTEEHGSEESDRQLGDDSQKKIDDAEDGGLSRGIESPDPQTVPEDDIEYGDDIDPESL
jgi:hypothetical protein